MADNPNNLQPPATSPTPPQAGQPETPGPAAPPPQQQIVHTHATSYNDDDQLTLEGMRSVIAAGGSVLIHDRKTNPDGTTRLVGSKLHTSTATLPTSAELAKTPEEKDAARKQLEADQKRIQEQLASLKAK